MRAARSGVLCGLIAETTLGFGDPDEEAADRPCDWTSCRGVLSGVEEAEAAVANLALACLTRLGVDAGAGAAAVEAAAGAAGRGDSGNPAR
jgi:hypothetical protein